MIQIYIYVKDKSYIDELVVVFWNVVGILFCKLFSEKEWFKFDLVIDFSDELIFVYKKDIVKSSIIRGNVQNNL